MQTKNYYILGGGGQAQVLYDICQQREIFISGIISHTDPWIKTIKNFSDNDVWSHVNPSDVIILNGIGIVSKNRELRIKLIHEYEKRNFLFVGLQHPKAIISNLSIIASSAHILAGSFIGPYASIGEHTIINTGAQVDHGCKIGRNVHICPGAILCGDVNVEDNVYIGPGAVIGLGVKLSAGSTIRANNTILKDI